jgi:putative FmdB family regulatory protein
MPTYEYECKKCSHRFEVFQSMSDAPVKKCPECGKEVRRLISGGAGVIFKGSGFYVTDKDKACVPKKDADAASKTDGIPKTDGTPKTDAASKADGTTKADGASKGGGAKGKAKPAA